MLLTISIGPSSYSFSSCRYGVCFKLCSPAQAMSPNVTSMTITSWLTTTDSSTSTWSRLFILPLVNNLKLSILSIYWKVQYAKRSVLIIARPALLSSRLKITIHHIWRNSGLSRTWDNFSRLDPEWPLVCKMAQLEIVELSLPNGTDHSPRSAKTMKTSCMSSPKAKTSS